MEPPNATQRRTLARIERRAVAAHERDLLADLRELALIEAACVVAGSNPDGLGSIELQLTGRLLVLRGVAPSACRMPQRADHPLRLVAVGRYDTRWWITLSDGQVSWSVLALRVYLSPNQGGLSVETLVA
ncbi:hypothetical protein [Jatrophihabitans sp.]|uniref:hypothetical protein n=1 Tax=Jatrophihabitans sp. TaxID=1932789 RepID=UPI0030C700C4|nr:hypothetical protein [Jatrophihabitans sp.]